MTLQNDTVPIESIDSMSVLSMSSKNDSFEKTTIVNVFSEISFDESQGPQPSNQSDISFVESHGSQPSNDSSFTSNPDGNENHKSETNVINLSTKNLTDPQRKILGKV